MKSKNVLHQPNIILINCDDLGYGDLGCYGSRCNNTPIIDAMAQAGIRFTDFYSAAPVCSPSRGALMTGCYPRRIGFDSFDGDWVLFPGHGIGLNPSEVTIAKLLKNAGYKTMLIGKWHCGDQPEFLPTRHGFDHYYGLPYSNDMGRQNNRYAIERGFPPLPLMKDEEVIQQQPVQESLTERYVEQAVRFIRENSKRPFFLYFAHMYVHLPLYVPENFAKRSRNGAFGAAVECIDWSVGVILNELKRLGIEKDTLVVFTSDNGARGDNGSSNAPLKGGKGTTWEGGMRVPCIMYWPGRIPQNSICSSIVTAMDFYTTFASLAGIQIPDNHIIDGLDMRWAIGIPGCKKQEREAFFYYRMDKLEAVRAGKWKLHVFREDKQVRELYNLEDDIGENNNIYDKHPEIVKKLEGYLEKCREDIGDGATGIRGRNIRPAGRVENPVPLTCYDPGHPYIVAMYDSDKIG
ncbi:MAG TPA: sulfatase [Clostridiaceae bacterium]|nr:sulfatase [Clostridiaceae bacterium]